MDKKYILGSILLFIMFGLNFFLLYSSFTGDKRLVDSATMVFASLFFYIWGKGIIFKNIKDKNKGKIVFIFYRFIVIALAILIPFLVNHSNINITNLSMFIGNIIILIILGFDLFHFIDTALRKEVYDSFSAGEESLGINLAIYLLLAVSLYFFYPYMKS